LSGWTNERVLRRGIGSAMASCEPRLQKQPGLPRGGLYQRVFFVVGYPRLLCNRGLQEAAGKSAPWASAPHVVRHSAAAPAIVGPLVECLLPGPGCQSNLGYPVVVCINECFSSSGTPGCFATGVYKRPQGKAHHGLRLLTLYDTLPLHLPSSGACRVPLASPGCQSNLGYPVCAVNHSAYAGSSCRPRLQNQPGLPIGI
jgi:hypothetical protein